ncbi:MAG: hypothetical protein U1F41_14280 [Burkholderiales bacterium]
MRTLLSKSTPACVALALTALGAPALAQHVHSAPNSAAMAPLVEKVRTVTAKYADVAVATKEGWVQATPCVSSPNAGAMGVHYVLPSRVGDGAINASEPEALIYEPQANGSLRLVGVEYIVIAADWARSHKEGGTPSVDGHLMHYVSEPNRYGLPAFYEMHVWAWERNPSGHFVDFNTKVTCDNQAASPS